MRGKKRRKSLKEKGSSSKHGEDVIQLNIIMDFDPGDDINTAVKRVKTGLHSPTDPTTYISRGKTFHLTPLRVEVPSVESLLQRYGKYLASPNGSYSTDHAGVSASLSSSPPVQLSTSLPTMSENTEVNRSSRSRKVNSHAKKISDVQGREENASDACKLFRIKPVPSTDLCNGTNDDGDHSEEYKIDDSAASKHRTSANASRNLQAKKCPRPSLKRKTEELPDALNTSKEATKSDVVQSLPPRIQLKKDWMKKLFSRNSERKSNENEGTATQVAQDEMPTDLNTMDECNSGSSSKNELELELTDTPAVGHIKVEKDLNMAEAVEVEGINSDHADLPLITEEIGNISEVRLEKILVKQEESETVEQIEKEQSRPVRNQINFIQFNEDSYDEEGPSEDPLMLADDIDVSVIEDEVIEVPAFRNILSTIHVENNEVNLVDGVLNEPTQTQDSTISIVKTVGGYRQFNTDCEQLEQDSTVDTSRSMSETIPEFDERMMTVDDNDNYATELSDTDKLNQSELSSVNAVNQTERTKVYNCPYCDAVYGSSVDLEEHGQMLHAKHQSTPRKPYACPKCRKRFSTIRWIRVHLSRMHKNILKQPSVVNIELPEVESGKTESNANDVAVIFRCTFDSCTDTFESEEELNDHTTTIHCTGSQPKGSHSHQFQCPECPMSFSWHSNLTTHRRFSHSVGIVTKNPVHEDASISSSLKADDRNKTYSCPYPSCSRNFPSEAGLQKHTERGHDINKMSHPRRKYCCSLCPSSFSHSSSLSSHVRYYHNNGALSVSVGLRAKPVKSRSQQHPCQLCGISFRWATNLHAHVRFMHNKQENSSKNPKKNSFAFSCSECANASFESMELLSKHKQQMHRPIQKTTTRPNSVAVHPTSSSHNIGSEASSEASGATQAAFSQELPFVTLSDDEGERSIDTFFCPSCDVSFLNNGQLQDHLSTHSNMDSQDVNGLSCTPPSESFSSVTNLELHPGTHLSNKDSSSRKDPYPCSMCHMSFLYPKSLKIHQSLVHKKRKQRPRGNRHKNRPTPDSSHVPQLLNYICVQCDNLAFSSSDDLQRHNQVIHRQELAVALICQSGNSEAEASSNANCEQTGTVCEKEPDSVLSDMNSGDMPEFGSHELDTFCEPNILSTSMTPHECPDCFEQFSNLTEFEKHVATHVQRYFQCPECPLQFNQASYLLEHKESSHSNAALPEVTDLQCDANTTQEPELDESEIQCSLCPRKFKKKSHLQMHEKFHLRENIRKTITSKLCRRRSPKNEDPTATTCPICGCYIAQARNLRRHVQGMHRLIMSDAGFVCFLCSKSPVVVPASPSGEERYICCKNSTWTNVPHALPRGRGPVNNPNNSETQSTTCPVCSLNLSHKRNLERHIITSHKLTMSNKTFICAVCNKLVPYSIEGEEKYMCCGYKSQLTGQIESTTSIEQPNAVKDVISELAVQEAQQLQLTTTTTVSAFHSSSPTTTGSKAFQCKLCHKRFPRNSSLRQHEYAAHRQLRQNSSKKNKRGAQIVEKSVKRSAAFNPASFPAKYRCGICWLEFHSGTEIEFHIRKAHKGGKLPDKPFHCATCPKTFLTMKGIQTHFSMVHKEDDGLPARRSKGPNMGYPCSCCPRTFSKLSHRHNHIRSSHAGEGAYKCSHRGCGKGFETPHDRHAHITSTHASSTSVTPDPSNYAEQEAIGPPVQPYEDHFQGNSASDPTLHHYWFQQQHHNSSIDEDEQDLSEFLPNVETVEIGGGIMMKGEVEIPDYNEPDEAPDFEFQAVEPGVDDEVDADYTFNIISHPPLGEDI